MSLQFYGYNFGGTCVFLYDGLFHHIGFENHKNLKLMHTRMHKSEQMKDIRASKIIINECSK